MKQINYIGSYIDSREVAEMVGKTHKMLLRDIRRYTEQLNGSNIAPVEFWQESVYEDEKGESRPCYTVTKKGCEFIAHKLTGTKGTAFTAKYINRFHEMESRLANDGTSKEVLQQVTDFIQQQVKFNQEIMSKLELLENNGNIYEEFYKNCLGEKSQLEERKAHLYRQVAEASELYGQSQTTILHSLYCALEKLLGINLDSYKSVYHSETGNKKAGMVEVIAANDRLYENAVHMNEYALNRNS